MDKSLAFIPGGHMTSEAWLINLQTANIITFTNVFFLEVKMMYYVCVSIRGRPFDFEGGLRVWVIWFG